MELQMNSDQIMATLISIGETPGKNDKVSMIAACAGSTLFVTVLKAALEPHTTYGIAKRLPQVAKEGGKVFDLKTNVLLSDLATRRLSGHAALAAIEAECKELSPESEELLWRIITKDLKGGFGDSTVNKAIKGLISDFPYMRCSLPKEVKLETYDWNIGVFSQEKADGMYFNVDKDFAGRVTMSSRQGTQFPLDQLSDIVTFVEAHFPDDMRLNGEVEVERDGKILPREIGNGIMNHIQDGGTFGPGERPILKLWDAMPLSQAVPKGRFAKRYASRFGHLKFMVGDTDDTSPVRVIDTRVVHSLAEAYAHYGELLAEGKEGTVIKCPNGIWMDTTSKFQCKLKLEFAVDLKIVGFEPGKGKNASTFGSVITETNDGLLRVCVSGFKDKPGKGYLTRSQIWEMKDQLLNTIMTVTANGVMSPGASSDIHSLFLPRFTEFRRDKTIADSLQSVFDQYEAAKNGVSIAEARFQEKLAA